MTKQKIDTPELSRRGFLKASAATSTAALISSLFPDRKSVV